MNTEDEEDDRNEEPLLYSDEEIYWYGESPPFFDEESHLFEVVHPFPDEGDEQCNIMNTKIPWQKIVEHHKEITRRAEEAFFSLLITNQPSDRWSSIDHFSPEHLHGPWKIADSSLTSLPLKRSIFNEENRELYLGGPCFVAWKKNKNGFSAFWQPILYRAVRVTSEEDGFLVIEPDQGNWDISPLVYDFLDRKNICPEQPFEELMMEIIEKAHKYASDLNEDITSYLINGIGQSVPELGEKLQERFNQKGQASKPSDWVLFTPAEASALTRNLLSDYNQLERVLQQDADAIGGLQLLVQGVNLTEDRTPASVLPIVPLNESQLAAVEGILRKKPVTVISGPPGCGKSQVVVSTILNAWAQGSTVLFASNNNEAVDVVRERLKPFEDLFPISVRAGKRDLNNVQEVIRRVINIIGYKNEATRSMQEVSVNERNELLKQKLKLQAHLESKLPQIVSQSVHSAINAYGIYRETRGDLEGRIKILNGELAELGYSMEPGIFETAILNPFQEWINEIGLVKTNITQCRIKYRRYTDEIDYLTGKREHLFASIGGVTDAIESWEWLSTEATIEKQKSWLTQFKTLMETPLEDKLKPYYWRTDFDFWKNEEHARQWADEAVNVSGQIFQMLIQEKRLLIESFELESERASARQNLENAGIHVHEEISPETIKDWLQVYSFLNSIPQRSFDWLPFSEKNRSLREIRKIENNLRRQVPVSVWRDAGTLDAEGRARLCRTLELIDKWQKINEKWQSFSSTRLKIDKQFDQVRDKLQELQFYDFPDGWDISLWEETARQLSERAQVAEQAAISHFKKREYMETQNTVVDVCKSFQSLNSGLPVREYWVKQDGAAWKDVTDKVISDFDLADVNELKKLYYEGSMDKFIATWDEMSKIQAAINENKHQLEILIPESTLIEQWWSRCPDGVVVGNVERESLPEKGHEVIVHLDECKKWSKKWQNFKNIEYPEFVNKIKVEEERALGMLRSAVDKFLEERIRESFMEVVLPVLNKEKEEWPLQEIARSVEKFSPERLKAQIQAIDAKLEAVTFESARYNRVDELSKDTTTQVALDRLNEHYARGRGRIEPSGFRDFRNSLKALPVWITTALSAQSIPMIPDLFDLLVIDEATQCTLTNLLPLIYRTKRIVVIGDPEQLPAIDTINIGAEMALASKLGIVEWIPEYGHANNNVYRCFVKVLPGRHADVLSLTEHYRSHPMIIGFSNQHIYQKRLILRKNPDQAKCIPYSSGMHGLNVPGECRRGKWNTSWCNEPEAKEIVNIISKLKGEEQYSHVSIGVISPFRAQVELIVDKLEKYGIMRGVQVGTVHKYQGNERDVIIFSPVVSRGIPEATARWVENPANLINVAVTRAREGLFFVGDFEICRRQPGILGKLTKYIETIMTLRKTSLVELDLFSWMVVCGWDPEIHCRISDIEVDFVLRNATQGVKLAIEVDGLQHDKTKVKDASRDAFLISKGYKVLRFSARDVQEVPARVIKEIETAYHG